MLKDHPCILGWVCMNESRSPEANRIGEAIEQAAHRLDPARPTIRNSWDEFDLASGDSHYYDGGLGGGKYTDIVRRNHKMLSEFGADVPASMANLRSVPALAKRLEKLAPHIPDLHEYQYRLIKYQIEHLRIRKYNPCSGYFHFMWIDLCPQSFYGVYDYWGNPKSDGPGGDGGLRAFEEANSPIGIFMEHVDQPEAIWAVNDLDRDIDGCLAQWWVTTQEGREIAGGEQELSLPADTGVRVAELSFPVQSDVKYRVHLALRDAQGNDLARNRYDDPFHHPTLRPGYPWRIDHEIGVRLWDA